MVFPPLLARRKREGSYPFWIHRVRPRNGLVRASRRAIHLPNRPKYNGPVYAVHVTTLVKISAPYARRPTHPSAAKGRHDELPFAADGIRENGKSNIWVGPKAGPGRLARGLPSPSATCA